MSGIVRKLSVLAVLGLAFGATSSVNAAMESFSYTTPTNTVPFTTPFTLAGFDTKLGTLTGVTLTVSSSITAQIIVQNTTTSMISFTNAFASIPVTVTGPGTTSISETATATQASGSVAPAQTFMINGSTFTANGTSTYSGITASNSVTVGDPNLAQYQSVGGVPVAFTATFATGSYGGTSPPGLLFGGSATASGTTTVTYTYTAAAVPEPASLGMVVLGLGGVFAARRFRRKSA